MLQFTMDAELRRFAERVAEFGHWIENDERDLIDVAVELGSLSLRAAELRDAAEQLNNVLGGLVGPQPAES